MQTSAVRILLRHISGARATEVDEIPVGAHRELILGRAASAAVRFDPRRDTAVGRHHARIEMDESAGVFTLVDLGSRNGTRLNGEPVRGPERLRPGDVVQLGEAGPEFIFLVEQASAAR